MKKFDRLFKFGFCLLFGATVMISCDKDDDDHPDHEHEEEVITDVKLIFTNDADATDIVTARAEDPDGEGVEELTIVDDIELDANKTYTLTFEIENNLGDETEDIREEIEEHADDHQLFFSFSNDAFANPTGNGNIDAAADPINYNDEDENGYPLGLSTTWTTSASSLSNGTFTVRLQHQHEVKTATSTANDGDTDFDLEFVLKIQ
jgi:hypothetical protein